MKSMLIRPVGDICDSECQVACGPSVSSVSANSGSGGTRQSHANRSNIGTPLARRSNRLPTANVIGEIISTAKAPTLKSKPTVPQIINRPIAATPIPAICRRRRNLAKRQCGERHREQRLALHDHAGKPDRHAFRDRPGLRQELSEKQRDADRGEQPPGDIRLAHEQARHRRDGKAQRRHQRGREFVEREPRGHEPKPPDQRHQDGETNVGWLHP